MKIDRAALGAFVSAAALQAHALNESLHALEQAHAGGGLDDQAAAIAGVESATQALADSLVPIHYLIQEHAMANAPAAAEPDQKSEVGSQKSEDSGAPTSDA